MSMLSSVANRLYWLSRYLERTEGTARILNAYSQMVLDLPSGSELGWEILISYADADQAFKKRYKNANERNVLKFMIADLDNFSSLRFSVKAARENIRTTRDVLPKEAWELINELHLYVEENAEKAVQRRGRFKFLEEVISRTQQFNGLITTSLSRDRAFTFLKVGQLLETADVASRIVDVAAAAILSQPDQADPYLPSLWVNLLDSLSASSAYRREIGPLVNGNEVVDFIFKSEFFPRSIIFCLNILKTQAASLGNNKAAIDQINKLKVQVDGFTAEETGYAVLHDFINKLQFDLGTLNDLINSSWFAPQA